MFLQGGGDNLSSSSFSFSWMELILPLVFHYPLGKGKKKKKSNPPTWNQAERVPLRAGAASQEEAFSGDALLNYFWLPFLFFFKAIY